MERASTSARFLAWAGCGEEFIILDINRVFSVDDLKATAEVGSAQA
jgi:hypothetical protein